MLRGLLTVFSSICLERIFVVKMPDLWHSEEEQHLQKSFLDCTRESPTGSLCSAALAPVDRPSQPAPAHSNRIVFHSWRPLPRSKCPCASPVGSSLPLSCGLACSPTQLQRLLHLSFAASAASSFAASTPPPYSRATGQARVTDQAALVSAPPNNVFTKP